MSQTIQHLKGTFLVNLKQYDGYEKSLFDFWFDIMFLWSQTNKFCMKYCLHINDYEHGDGVNL